MVELFAEIERVKSLVDGAVLKVPYTVEHRWAMSSDGRAWARKRILDTGHQALAAEAVSYLLARRLHLAVPNGAVYVDSQDDHETSWLSERVNPATHWMADKAIYINNIQDIGGLLTLDVLTMNEDRHAGNLLLQPAPDESQLKVWGIDSGNALIGYPADYDPEAVPSPHNLAPGVPLELIRAHAMATAARAEKLSPDELWLFVVEAGNLGKEPKLLELHRCLARRCQNATVLTSAYLARLEARR